MSNEEEKIANENLNSIREKKQSLFKIQPQSVCKGWKTKKLGKNE